ncbi:MAG: glucosyltransferase domain-containing protein, partial [Lachnospiraceae bacterium]|nr:glucosyltransferase domain-containing protein [Lachnospiraceae bacterium]
MGFVVGILTYFSLMANHLVNDLDGIWHLSNFMAGDWEISLGRGLQRYADRARFGIVSDAFNSLLTIGLFSISNALILYTLSSAKQCVGIGTPPHNSMLCNTTHNGSSRHPIVEYLFCVIMIANPIACCSLSYSYMSVNFGLAYFCSSLSGCIICFSFFRKNKLLGMLTAALCLSASLAFYQSYIGIFCVMCLASSIILLRMDTPIRKTLLFLGYCFITLLFAGVLYYFLVHALLHHADISFSSYRGADQLHLSTMILQLPTTILSIYKGMWGYFWETQLFSGLEFMTCVLIALLFLYGMTFIYQFTILIRKNRSRAFLYMLLTFLLPIASCFVMLLAVGNEMSIL